MTFSEDDEDENLASFLESEILSGVSDDHQDEENPNSPPSKKKQRLGEEEEEEEEEEEDEEEEKKEEECSVSRSSLNCNNRNTPPKSIETGVFSKVPPELFYQILKFLSSEDLIACSLVCRYLNYAASDESLWRRLYCMRWGLVSPTRKLRESAWKALYIQRDQEDMVEFVRNTPSEFKGYYIQMQAAKRSQAPLPSQVNEDHIILDRTVADQVSLWKVSRGLTDDVVMDHVCSGKTCSYSQIGDVFMCEKTGRVHVCDDTCREVVTDTVTGLLVCTISGHCFDSMLSSAETEPDDEQEQQGGATDEGEPFMGSAWAFLRGYGCSDEKELKSAMRGFGY